MVYFIPFQNFRESISSPTFVHLQPVGISVGGIIICFYTTGSTLL